MATQCKMGGMAGAADMASAADMADALAARAWQDARLLECLGRLAPTCRLLASRFAQEVGAADARCRWLGLVYRVVGHGGPRCVAYEAVNRDLDERVSGDVWVSYDARRGVVVVEAVLEGGTAGVPAARWELRSPVDAAAQLRALLEASQTAGQRSNTL